MIWISVFWVPLVSSKLAEILGFKGYLPRPLTPTPRSKPELGQPLLSRERAQLRGRGKTENWDSPLVFKLEMLIFDYLYNNISAGVYPQVQRSSRKPASYGRIPVVAEALAVRCHIH